MRALQPRDSRAQSMDTDWVACRAWPPGLALRHARVAARGAAETVKVTAFSFPAPRALRCGPEGCSGPPKFSLVLGDPRRVPGRGLRVAQRGPTPSPRQLVRCFLAAKRSSQGWEWAGNQSGGPLPEA